MRFEIVCQEATNTKYNHLTFFGMLTMLDYRSYSDWRVTYYKRKKCHYSAVVWLFLYHSRHAHCIPPSLSLRYNGWPYCYNYVAPVTRVNCCVVVHYDTYLSFLNSVTWCVWWSRGRYIVCCRSEISFCTIGKSDDLLFGMLPSISMAKIVQRDAIKSWTICVLIGK